MTIRFARGFTLIELIAVIVILGVLAAVATPIFLNGRNEAIGANLAAQAGALRTAVDQARLVWRVRGGGTGAITDLAGWQSNTADFNANGWIMGTSYSSGNPTNTHCAEIWRSVMGNAAVTEWTGSPTPGSSIAAQGSTSMCIYYPLDGTGTAYLGSSGYASIAFDTANLSGYGSGTIWTRDMSGAYRYWRPPS